MVGQTNASTSPHTPTLNRAQGRSLDAVAAEIERRSGAMGNAVAVDWREELTLRSRLLGMWPNGRISASGACRILRAADGWVALSVARPWDHDVLPAMIEGPIASDHWSSLEHWVAHRSANESVGRARLLDVAAAELGSIPSSAPMPMSITRPWPSGARRRLDRLRVVDLSSLWAGPLVARILRAAGAHVMKVESSSRLDGARLHPAFYRALHPEDEDHVMVELTAEEGRSKLRGLIEDADVVIEASRPRALRQLGAGSDQMPPRPGRVWLSITGYGRREPGSQWIAFGDDAAVAGGLVGRTEEGGPEFCADAVADPVTGLFGAAAVLRSLEVGGGHLIDLALAGSAAAIARATEPFDAGDDSTGAKPWMS